MEEKNNQNNPGSAADDIIIEEDMDNSAEAIKNCGQRLKACEADKGEYHWPAGRGAKSGFGQRPKRRRRKEGRTS